MDGDEEVKGRSCLHAKNCESFYPWDFPYTEDIMECMTFLGPNLHGPHFEMCYYLLLLSFNILRIRIPHSVEFPSIR